MSRLAPPPKMAIVKEARVMLEMARMVVPLAGAHLRSTPDEDDRLVIVVPGFGADDRFTAPLRRFLKRRGFKSEGWGMGVNRAGLDLPHSLEDLSDRWPVEAREEYRGEAAVPFLCDRFIDRVRERHEESGRRIVLVGWSLGGYIAREAARDLPREVEQVITLGSPIIGGPKYTATAPFFSGRGMDLDWIERSIRARDERIIEQPVTAIYSKSDAIVSWRAAIDRISRSVRHIEVNGSHLGMTVNPTVWRHIEDALLVGV